MNRWEDKQSQKRTGLAWDLAVQPEACHHDELDLVVQPKPYHHDEKRLHLGQRVKGEDQGREGGREGGSQIHNR